MKVRFKLLFSICILSFFASCVDIKLDFCEDPVTEDLTGIVIDPATSLPVVGAKVTYSNTSDPIHASDKSTTTDEEGKFSVTESGCKHGDWYDLLYFQSASHPEYD